jgi:glycosyltransferase involved in cell wall biosynthesis
MVVTLSQKEEQDQAIPENRGNSNSKLGIQESRLIIGLPTFNEEDSIAKTIVKLSGLGDIVVCDDGSSDATEEIARGLGCRIVKHPRKLGRSDCITSLFLAARRLRADELMILDAETYYSAEDLEVLLNAVRSGDCDIAIGSRIIDSVRDSGAAKGLSDPESLLEVYGREALALIAPSGTSSVVRESDVLEFADQQGLKVKEYPRTGAVEAPQVIVREKNTEPILDRITSLVALKYPAIFFGIPSLGILSACAVQAFVIWQWWRATGAMPGIELISYYEFALLISTVLGVTSVILESMRIIRSRRSNTERSIWDVRAKKEKQPRNKSDQKNAYKLTDSISAKIREVTKRMHTS